MYNVDEEKTQDYQPRYVRVKKIYHVQLSKSKVATLAGIACRPRACDLAHFK